MHFALIRDTRLESDQILATSRKSGHGKFEREVTLPLGAFSAYVPTGRPTDQCYLDLFLADYVSHVHALLPSPLFFFSVASWCIFCHGQVVVGARGVVHGPVEPDVIVPTYP